MMWRSKNVVTIVAVLLAIGSIVTGWRWLHSKKKPSVPTVEVQQRDFVEFLELRGEIEARESRSITAPMSAGELQIISLLKTGTIAKAGDVVVQFDPTTVKRTFDERQAELRSNEALIRQSRAKASLNGEQKTTDLLAAKYDVERAKLDVSKQEIVSEIEGEKSRLTLANNEEKLSGADVAVKSVERSGRADIAEAELKRKKAAFDASIAQHQLSQLVLKAPVDGMVVLRPNLRASNWMEGNSRPDFKQGDKAWPGAEIASMPDMSTVRFLAHADEIDRGRINLGQISETHVDALPELTLRGKVSEISMMGKPDFTIWPPQKNFDIVVDLTDKDQRLRPGMSADARIQIDRVPNSIVVPAEAVFEKNGQFVVYVQHGAEFEARVVNVGRRSGKDVLIHSGLSKGERIATKDPTATDKQGTQP